SLSIHAQLLDRIARDLVPRDGGVARTKPPSRKSMKRIVQSCAAIQEEVDRLRQCVDDFIEAARPHKPVLVLNDLNRFVESVVRMADLELEALGIQIEMLLEPDLPAILADERLIQSALRNLLRNAVEAIEAARRPADQRRVTLRTWAVDESVMLEIADTGCGIAREDMPKIFEPYFTTKFDGSGLGLMAVVRIVRDHNGEISVKSEEGAGTTFTVELPVATRRQKLLESA
ncbi:MAG TPA: ATP-binding protein, partial [Sumerlaeia bacterium]|nr:ATP-binding protein [Sumerlaeia bacterium]